LRFLLENLLPYIISEICIERC